MLRIFAFLSVLFSGAIFGFFYAWVCSTMWGLDAADPRIAITAMQAMNASVRNIVFAPAFFGTPFILLFTAGLAHYANARQSAWFFGLGGITYLFGGMILTAMVNVPMNVALAQIIVPDDTQAATQIWAQYSPRWQSFNIIRTLFSGIALLLAAAGVYTLDIKTGSGEKTASFRNAPSDA